MLKVGIIDSGLPQSCSFPVLAEYDFTSASIATDLLGHGSAVSNIISGNSEINILSARVFHDKLTCTPSQVADAIQWLISYKVDVINMSFGLRNDRPILRACCEQALQNNIILVAAAPSQGEPVFPSHYKGIIRATGDARCAPGEISWLDSAQADFGGYSGRPHLGPAGASIGCASVTASLVQLKIKHPNYDQNSLTQALIKQSIHQGSQARKKSR